MAEATLSNRENLLARRQTLEPGERTKWHTDAYYRLSVFVRGSMLAIAYADTGEVTRFPVSPGEADWDAPTDRVYRSTDVGPDVFEEVTLFVLATPGDDPQPQANL